MLNIIMFLLKGKRKHSFDFISERFNPEVELGNNKKIKYKISCHETLRTEGKGNSGAQLSLLNNCCFQVFWGLSALSQKKHIYIFCWKCSQLKKNRSTRMYLIALNDLLNYYTAIIAITIKKILSQKLLFCCSTTF